MAEIDSVLKDRMDRFAEAFSYFHDIPEFGDCDTNQRIKLWEIFVKRLDAKPDNRQGQGEGGGGRNRPTDRQYGMIRRLIKNNFLTEEEVGELNELTFKQASDLITKGVAAEKSKGSQGNLPFQGGAQL